MLILREATEDLFISSNEAYFDAFNEEHQDAREEACHLTELRWEEETLHEQHCDAFDDKFIESLENVIQVIQQEKTASRAKLSATKENEMNTLLGIVKAQGQNRCIVPKGARKRDPCSPEWKEVQR